MLEQQIREGLSLPDKQLPCVLLYDALGSRLFEAITQLPEYGVAAADLRQLQAHCAELVDGSDPWEIVELGPGGGHKARLVCDALRARQPSLRFSGIDVSAQALADCRRTLGELDGVEVVGIEGTYLDGLARASAQRAPGTRQLVLMLGSNLSNFERTEAAAFLRDVRARLSPGDRLVLAVDLDKEPARLLPAYDDALGVTAAFNLNVLLRLNREWGAEFSLDAFAHEARWNADDRRIEMHLVAQRACEVPVHGVGVVARLKTGESLWTESSHRFSMEELRAWANAAGFGVRSEWIDEEWPFVQTLLEAR